MSPLSSPLSSPFHPGIATLSGYAPALPTPFRDDDSVDIAALEHLCERQIQDGATALVACGTTGEAPTLSRAEHRAVVRTAVRVSRGRVPVIAGAGSNATDEAVALAREAEADGADALLVVTPYYNRPTQAGLLAHFRAVGAATGLPVILYDVPARTACALADTTVARLAELPGFIGLKDATGDISRPARLRALLGSGFRLLSGDDATAFAFLAQGGDGCISVTSNVTPGLCRRMAADLQRGDLAEAQRIAALLAPLTAALFGESSPVPVKYALSLLGLMTSRVRLPLVGLRDETKHTVAVALRRIHDASPDALIASLPRAPLNGFHLPHTPPQGVDALQRF